MPGDEVPCAGILAVQDGTRLRLRIFGGEHKGKWVVVELNRGDVLLFRGDVCHNGLGYAVENVRIHFYIDSPAYNLLFPGRGYLER